MKRFALVLLATSAMSALAFQSASAADLPLRPAPVFKAPVVVPAPVYNWTGFSTRVRDLGTIAGRLGVVVGTSGAVLLFVKGGGGFADDKFTATTTGSCDNTGNCNSNPDF